jgi:hypothetical protein
MRCTALGIGIGIVLLLAGCGDERSRGIIFTDDGRVLDNSAESARTEVTSNIEHDIGKAVAPHWKVVATLAELPEWHEVRETGEWRWQKATMTVTVTGDGSAPLPVSLDEIRASVRDYMLPKVYRAKTNLGLTVTQAIETPKPAVAGAGPLAAPLATGERRYAIQQGDTLADISTAFYGSPQHWRDIVNANAGLNPAGLRVGDEIVIPALAAPSPSPGDQKNAPSDQKPTSSDQKPSGQPPAASGQAPAPTAPSAP